jgi:prolyl oligopeptidase
MPQFPTLFLIITALAAFSAQAQQAARPAAFPAKNVPETFFGTVVDDPYRGLEDTKNPDVTAWARAQADYARAQLDSITGAKKMRARIAELDDSTTSLIGSVRRDSRGTLFFTRRGATDNTFKLYKKEGPKETLLADPDDWQKQTGKPHAINYFEPSPDGKLIAFGVSSAGSEDASIYVLDTASLARIGEPVDRAQYPEISWRPDSRSFFFLRQQEMKPGMPSTERYRFGRSWLHVVDRPAAEDQQVAGPDFSPRMKVRPEDFPFVLVIPGSRHALGMVVNYTAPLDKIGKPGTPWVKITGFDDKVTDLAARGDSLYLLTYRDSARFSVLRTTLSKPDIKKATTVVGASQRVIMSLAAAKDALYLEVRDGAVKRLMRRSWDKAKLQEVRLPLEGAASIMAARPDVEGVVLGLSAWTRARQVYAVDASGKAANTNLQPLGSFGAPAGLVATEVRVKSHDGAMVPLSIIHRADVKLDGSNPTLLYGYGAYGITEEPGFRATRLAWLEKGGVYAVANVRGSAVHGQDWYKAGYKATKPNTWKDFIACAEHLVAQKYTTPQKLGILGGSAGGILVGRAMTERPDLFAAVVPAVGLLDAVRAETTANGIPNIPEFGTVKKEDEFRALLAMSSYHHVKEGTAYPAVLLMHGVNDPRVDYWHSSKMAARLMAASTSGKPILLDLDFDAGHGIGSTKQQRQKEIADIYSFLFWQAGHPDFQRGQ